MKIIKILVTLSFILTLLGSKLFAMQYKNCDARNRTRTVSYLYYPYWGDQGHAELEIDGECWTLKKGHTEVRSFQKRIDKRKNEPWERCLPFYRYVITVTPDELKQLKMHVGKRSFYSIICSMDALHDLSKHAHFNLPIPFRVSPMISACYLSSAKSLGSKRITKIDFYDNKETHHLIASGQCRNVSQFF